MRTPRARRSVRTALARLASPETDRPAIGTNHDSARCTIVPRASAARRLLSLISAAFSKSAFTRRTFTSRSNSMSRSASCRRLSARPGLILCRRDRRPLFIGLHGRVVRSPALTFVLPELQHGVGRLKDAASKFDQERLGNDVFNQATFRIRPECASSYSKRARSLRAARARSSRPAATSASSGFRSRGGSRAAFWESLGFVAIDEEALPFPRTPLVSDGLDLALYRTRAFRQPVLTFEDSDMQQRLTRLRDARLQVPDEMPDTLDDSTTAC